MDRKIGRRRAAALIVASVVFAGAAWSAPKADAQRAGESAADYAVSNLQDFTATMKVLNFNANAGQKINKDFGLVYKLQGDIKLSYKEANKLRLEGRIGAGKAILVVNGRTQYVRLESVRLHTKLDLGDEPGKRKTLLDVGLLSPAYLTYAKGEYMGMRPVEGAPCKVFKFTYLDQTKDTSQRILWIDPKTKVIRKREEYDQGKMEAGIKPKLLATYFYRDPKEVAPGVWLPTRIEARNNEGERAGETAYKDIKVNTGLPDSLFILP